MAIRTGLGNLKSELAPVDDMGRRAIAVCRGTGCSSSASAELVQALRGVLAAHGLGDQVEVRRTGCFGFCAQGPIVVVYPGEVFYTQVTPEDAKPSSSSTSSTVSGWTACSTTTPRRKA